METQTNQGAKPKIKLISVIVTILIGGLVLRKLGLLEILTVNNIDKIESWINMFGLWGPLIYILLYITASIFFLPGLPLTLLAPIMFGPTKGIILSSLGSTLGGTAAFLLARYSARDLIEDKFGSSCQFQKIDRGVKENGWKMLVITRTVPLFPYNVQNYIYGLTKINVGVYMVVSWLTMLPATVVCCCGAEAVVSGNGLYRNHFFILALVTVVFILVFMPNWIEQNIL